jgi:poly(A) polymerase
VAAGAIRGPAVGELIKTLENWWVENDFRADEAALRARLQEMVAEAHKTL